MAEYLIKGSTLTEIADAIRAKTGSVDALATTNFATAISGIQSGGGDGGTGVEKTVELNFADYLEIADSDTMDELLLDGNNVGKVVRYVGGTDKYTTNMFYRVVSDEYDLFDPNECSAVATEVTSDTSLTASINCEIGDLIIASFVIRSDLVSLSDGWTLIETSKNVIEINSRGTTNQTLSFAYKYATASTERLVVTQTTAARIYINMVAISDVDALKNEGFQYQNNAEVDDTSYVTCARPEEKVIIWGATRVMWDSSLWSASNESILVQSGDSSQPRLLLAIDISNDESVTFTSSLTNTTDAYLCGALSVKLKPHYGFERVGSSEASLMSTQIVIPADGTTFNKVNIPKPENLISENILYGVEIAGVIGSFKGAEIQDEVKYFVCNINSDAKVTTIHKVSYDNIYADKGTYDVVVPDVLVGNPVVLNSNG